MIKTKIVQRFGNSSHIVLPKEYIGKKVKFLVEPKTFDTIKSDILEILKPYLENILGVYLYGSYARNEQSIYSDVDILVITNNKLKIMNKTDDYSIVSVTLGEINEILKKNAILVLPIIKEARTIINPILLEKYKGYGFTKKNTKVFIDESEKILKLNKNGLKLDFETGSLVYSLILRLRGLLMIKVILNNELYSKRTLFFYLENNVILKNKILELYRIYSNERDSIKIRKSDKIAKKDIEKLLGITESLLYEVKTLLR